MKDAFPLIDTTRLEERESLTLAPYAMLSRESRGRRHPEEEADFRTCFQRDCDRIVHSTAFRRLEYKTQVFVNHEGDHYRTRLTHTLEVVQVSRAAARALGLNEDLTEAVALAHDLGHPPFGHSGEEALGELMEGQGGFDHNEHSLRVIDRLEKRYPEFDGLNLSWEVRESIIKHGGSSHRVRMHEDLEPQSGPLLEAQLADAADSLAYTSHDIDDGLRSNFIHIEDLRQVRLWSEAEAAVAERSPGIDSKTLVARTISGIIDRQVRDLVAATRARLLAAGIDSTAKLRAHPAPLVGFSSEMQALASEMQRFLQHELYRHHRVLKMAEKAKRFLRGIFLEYVRSPQQLPPDYLRRAEAESVHRAICDYLAGMTDRFCQEEYQRLFHTFERL